MHAVATAPWVGRVTTLTALATFLAIVWFGGSWSPTQVAGAFGFLGVSVGAAQQLRRPTTPGTRRVFAVLFALTCLGALLLGDRDSDQAIMIGIACVGGWSVGLGLAASFDPNDGAPMERSFSGQVIRRG